ncbi:unnamed protein product [Amoebophrya sp. A25]|nr:unnamed protein product [Amoebophrya sp. A25]|eukprot:GSA25T00025943001.1
MCMLCVICGRPSILGGDEREIARQIHSFRLGITRQLGSRSMERSRMQQGIAISDRHRSK